MKKLINYLLNLVNPVKEEFFWSYRFKDRLVCDIFYQSRFFPLDYIRYTKYNDDHQWTDEHGNVLSPKESMHIDYLVRNNLYGRNVYV